MAATATTDQDIFTSFVNAEVDTSPDCHDLPVALPAVNSNEDSLVDNLPVVKGLDGTKENSYHEPDLNEREVKILFDWADIKEETYGLAMIETEEKHLLDKFFIYDGVAVASPVPSYEDPPRDILFVDGMLDNITGDSCHESECADNQKKSNDPTEEELLFVYDAVDITNLTKHENREIVVVPEDIPPGESFYKNVGGWNMKITYPEHAWPNTEISVNIPAETDVLKCEEKTGRNMKVEDHPGNVELKRVVEENYEDYTKISATAQKTEFYRTIAKMVHSKYWKHEKGAWVQMTMDKEIHKFIASKFRNVTKRKDRAEKRKIGALVAPVNAPVKRGKTK